MEDTQYATAARKDLNAAGEERSWRPPLVYIPFDALKECLVCSAIDY